MIRLLQKQNFVDKSNATGHISASKRRASESIN